jgi:MFS transporter, PAT family, beta-lactamase induction signal transducer AmpG
MNSLWYANVIGPDIIVRDAHRHDSRPPLTQPDKPTLRQALGDKRIVAVLLMSFASGLPFNLSSFALQAWLASAGLNIKTIGLFSLVALPYIFKFLWAPLLDRYMPPILGRRRGWIVIYQAMLAVTIGVMGFCDPVRAPYVLAGIALVVAFLSASQDIVIDAYRVDTIPPSERGLAAAAAAFGYRTAAILASSVLVLIAAHTSWHLAFLVIAVIMAATMLGTLWAPEPLTPGSPPKTLADAVWHPLRDLVSRKGAWGFLLLVVLYKLGDAFALSLYSAFMIRGVGFSLDELSIFGKANMTVSTIIGVTVGGLIYMRWGMFRSLLVFGIGQSLTNLMYMWLALAGKKLWLMALATTLDTGVGGMGQAAFVGFLMSLCNPNFSATQYAILSAMASIPRVTTGAIAGVVVSGIGWANFFVLTCLTAAPGIILLVILRRPLKELEARDGADAKR